MRLPGEISKIFEKCLTNVKRTCQPHGGKSIDKLNDIGADYIIWYRVQRMVANSEIWGRQKSKLLDGSGLHLPYRTAARKLTP